MLVNHQRIDRILSEELAIFIPSANKSIFKILNLTLITAHSKSIMVLCCLTRDSCPVLSVSKNEDMICSLSWCPRATLFTDWLLSPVLQSSLHTLSTLFNPSNRNSHHTPTLHVQMHRWPSLLGGFVKPEAYTIWGKGFFKEKNAKWWIQ